MRHSAAWALFLWLAVAFAAPYPGPEIPSQDDFYQAPSGFEDKPNGYVLKLRNTPRPLRSVIFEVDIDASWQLLVRSEDSHGNPNAVVVTVIRPHNADPSKLLSYQAAEDSSSKNCAPSYSFQLHASQLTVTTEVEMVLIQLALQEGFYVVTPDYEGPNASFTAGVQSGHATLDGIKAALASGNLTGVHSDAKVAMWGYSGGTIATAWAAALQPQYAPSLKGQIVGAAMGGWVTNITATAAGVEGTLFAGLTAGAVGGLVNEYPDLLKLIDTEAPEQGPSILNQVHDSCLIQTILDFAFHRYFSGPSKTFNLGWGLFDIPLVKSIITNNTIALHEDGPMPEIPMFVYHGVKDTIAPFKEAKRGYDNWCKWGIKSFEFSVDTTAGHISEVWQGSPAGFAWVKKILNGAKPVDGCVRTNRTTNNDYPGANTAIGDIIRTSISSVFGSEIGPNGEGVEKRHVRSLVE